MELINPFKNNEKTELRYIFETKFFSMPEEERDSVIRFLHYLKEHESAKIYNRLKSEVVRIIGEEDFLLLKICYLDTYHPETKESDDFVFLDSEIQGQRVHKLFETLFAMLPVLRHILSCYPEEQKIPAENHEIDLHETESESVNDTSAPTESELTEELSPDIHSDDMIKDSHIPEEEPDVKEESMISVHNDSEPILKKQNQESLPVPEQSDHEENDTSSCIPDELSESHTRDDTHSKKNPETEFLDSS